MIRGVLIKTTLVDFPGKVASTYFMSGCNLYCPYCYNVELVEDTLPQEDSVSPSQLLEHLIKRQKVLGGVVLSGGEPLIHSELSNLIIEIKKLGLQVKLDTNGMLPDRLESLLKTKTTSPDFIALDVKTSPERYYELSREQTKSEKFAKNIQKTIKLLSKLPANMREFRTVLVPPLISKDEISKIAALLPKNASWQFANFRAENCLNKEYNNISPYNDNQIKQLVEYAHSLINGAELR
jgi:pyruvate formate lyase activating enzyme